MPRILVIGEKPSQVKKFRDVLLSNTKSTKHSKYIYSYEGIWRGTAQTYEVQLMPLTGHITRIDTPEEFGWGKIPPIELVKQPQALIKREDPQYKKILREAAKNADELFIATDPDSEGDNIGLEAYNIVIKANKKLKTNVKRVWNSSLTRAEILRSFHQAEVAPYGWDTRLALSVEGRQMTDAWLGFAGTREITQAARKIHPIRVFSVGRVQLPTLKMIVDRDTIHENFIPIDLWNLNAELQTAAEEKFEAKHHLSPFKDEAVANQTRERLKGAKTGLVLKVDRRQIKRKPPVPLNTTAALSLVAKLFKLKAKRVLEILSDLYLEGYLSYPRTENAHFTKSFPHKDILYNLRKNQMYNALISKVQNDTQVRMNGRLKKKGEDHDPIHPTGQLPPENPSGKLQKLHFDVLEVLSRYYIGLFMDDLVINKVKAEIEIKREIFIAEGSTIIEEGWAEAIYWTKRKEKFLPIIQEDEPLKVISIRKTKSKTKPKPRWNDATVLKQMERLGIGTKSSRPSVLEKLVERGYVIRQKHNQLVSQPPGRVLIQVLEPIWPEICTNQFTKHVETKMDEVATGQKPYSTMIDELRHEYIQAHLLLLQNLVKFQEALKQIDGSLLPGFRTKKGTTNRSRIKKGTTIKSHATKVKKSSQATTSCPLCQQGTQIQRQNRTTGEAFLGCSRYPECRWTQKIETTISKKSTPQKTSKPKTRPATKKQAKSSKRENSLCPICKEGKLIQRTNQASGNTFYGCSRYPQCRHTQTSI